MVGPDRSPTIVRHLQLVRHTQRDVEDTLLRTDRTAADQAGELDYAFVEEGSSRRHYEAADGSDQAPTSSLTIFVLLARGLQQARIEGRRTQRIERGNR